MPLKIDNSQRTFMEPPLEVWRPIHYLGSKLRLADSIAALLDELAPGPVCDLFAGSGTVALALSQARDVVAADIQEYSRVICTALLKPNSDIDPDELLRRAEQGRKELEPCLEPLLEYEQRAIVQAGANPELLCDLVEHGSLISDGAEGELAKALQETKRRVEKAKRSLLATTYFGGRYFSFKQALFIDSVLNEVEDETCLAALLSTVSTIVNSVGKQFAQPMQPRRTDGSVKSHLVKQMCRDRSHDAEEVFAGWLARYRGVTQERPHRVLRGDYREVLAEVQDVAVIYADPPYTRDHYSRFYHVLETLCLRDCPDVSTSYIGPTGRGLYRTDRHQSPFCIKSQAPGAFEALFAGAKGIPMLVSYSPFVKDGHPRLMTIEGVADLAKQHYRDVKIVSARLVHSKLNKADLHRDASSEAEVFIGCR